ncbi:hypothetical protein KI387_030566, partial [Taxus chinensis]
ALENVGSMAVIADVSPSQLVIANCEDSRVVLSRGGKAIPLSNDHKPEREDEMGRIEVAGGRFLAMSRALGDRFLKWYVISEPEVTCVDRTDEDECLILASDGLWDVLSNVSACEVARKCLAGYRPHRSKGITEDNPVGAVAALLTKFPLERRSGDKSSSPLSEASGKTEESNEEPFSRTSDQESESPTESHEQASPITVENLASGINVRDSILQNAVSQTEPSKQDPVVQLDSQYSIVKTAPSYASVGFVPQIISSHYPSYEPALTSPHDASRQPSIVIPGSDGDARFPPFVGPTAVSKYNGNATLLSGPSVSASQETATSVGVASAALTSQGSQMVGIAP